MGKSGSPKKAPAAAPEMSAAEKAAVLTQGTGSYFDAIQKSKLLNTLTAKDVKQMAKSKDDKAREFVLGKEHFEKQQAAKAAKAERDAAKAEREQKSKEREEKMSTQMGSGFANTASKSAFAQLSAEEEAEKAEKNKKQLRRGRGKKGTGDEDGSEDGQDDGAAASASEGAGVLVHLLAFVLSFAIVAFIAPEVKLLQPGALTLMGVLDEVAPGVLSAAIGARQSLLALVK